MQYPFHFPKIRDKLHIESELPKDAETANRIILACFLIKEGANTDIINKEGKSAIQTCPHEHAYIITEFKRTKGML